VVASPPLFRQPRYRGTSSPPHVRCLRAGTIVLALASAGCSLAYQLDTTLAKKEAADQSDPLGAALPRTAAELPAEGDLAIARAAVNEVLSKGASSMPWENPKTGARGTVTPLASVYNQAGIACRDFLASFVKNGGESWLQGAACRAKRGRWEVRNLRLWSNT
jgi:surface antigen